MINRVSLITVLSGLAIIGFILVLLRKGVLKTQYTILWLLLTLFLIALSTIKGLQDWISNLLGIYYPPAALFFCGFIFVLALLLYFTVVISQLSKENKLLAQEVALLKEKVDARKN